MRTLWQDVRYGWRVLMRTPGLTAVAVLSLALGIGANTALFSVVDAMLLKRLPVREPERLVLLKSFAPPVFDPGGYNGNSEREESGAVVRTSFPFRAYAALRAERPATVADLFAFGDVSLNVRAGAEAEVAAGQAVSGNYFAALGVEALHGRALGDEDDRPAAAPAAVISHRYWTRRFNADPAVVGRQLDLNNVPVTVVGVLPEGFNGTAQVGASPDVMLPLALEPRVAGERSRQAGAGVWWLKVMARLAPGATPEQARASLEGVFRQSVAAHRAERQARAQAQGGRPVPALDAEDFPRLGLDPGAQGEMNRRRYYARPLYLLLGAVGLVLLIACANVANLLLARAAARQREVAVRLALGASRRRLVRQLLTESVLLALAGGALGVLLAFWIKDGLLASAVWGGRGMSALDARMDLRVLLFTFALSTLTGLLFGLAPAWRTTRVDLTPALKNSGGASRAASRSLLSKSLVVAQVAMSLLVLVGAGLFLRTLVNLQRVEFGFNARNLLIFGVDPALLGYKEARLADLYERLAARVEAAPGVRSVTFSRNALLSFASSSRSLYLPSGGDRPADEEMYVHQVRENFLETMEIPLRAGRGLEARDDERAPRVAVVNETFARRFFPGENPVGKRLGFEAAKPAEVEIVGVAADAKYARQRDEVPPTLYLPWRQELRAMGSVAFEVRTGGDPETVVAAVRQAAREVEPALPLSNVKTQVEQAAETLAMERLFARLLSLFGVLAQTLAAVGLYGVLAWAVSQRTREIGIRMALGAGRRDVLAMVLRQGMALALAGVALGLAGAYALTSYLESMTSLLYGVGPSDPLTYGATAALLVAVALAACLVPARRATRVDPMEALRYE
jgi:predicted permease